MVTVVAEGVDYSRTPNANWTALAAALNRQGKRFVGRYAVTDKSPGGRGITAAEYQAMKAAGIEVFCFWEANTSWMLGGWQAGVNAANNAVANLRAAGLPLDMPVYYSHDIEPNPAHYDEVDQCLRGAASVVGYDAVGLYGGYGIIAHVAEVSHTAPWLCQTYAWSGGRLHPGAHLHQYNNYGNEIAGVDVDLVAALKPHYGQASDFTGAPKPPPKPVYAERIPIPGPIEAKVYSGAIWLPTHKKRWKALRDTERRQFAQQDAPLVGSAIKKGETVTWDYSVFHDDVLWFANRNGTRARADAFIAE